MKATLMSIRPSGMSNTTSSANHSQAGVAGSNKAAAENLSKSNQFRSLFLEAERKSGVPVALLQAIASRESRMGSALSPNGYGTDGHGWGIMQVDDRWHPTLNKSNGPCSLDNILHGATILKGSIADVKGKFPRWTESQLLQGGVAAYNCGYTNVVSLDDVDRKTTGNDYSNDTIARAQYYANAA